jgi:hypothetical protein
MSRTSSSAMWKVVASYHRCFATIRRVTPKVPPAVIDALPPMEMIPSEPLTDPAAFKYGPVNAVYCVDAETGTLSAKDYVSVAPNGTTIHGRYGEIPSSHTATTPLEYLALLHPAACAAAAVRQLGKKKSTVLIYGASQAAGIAAAQLATVAGHAVIAVVDGQHSGDEDCLESIKGMIAEPGTAVPEEFAYSKGNFADLVNSIQFDKDGIPAKLNGAQILSDFKANLLEYCQTYPNTRPAAVGKEHMEFHYMEKDRELWQINQEAYYSQFPPGAPPLDAMKLEANFDLKQYAQFRAKFWHQTTAVITGSSAGFSAPHEVQAQLEQPMELDTNALGGTGFPYAFSVLPSNTLPSKTINASGSPMAGAIIVATPTLQKAAAAVHAAGSSKRAQAEALYFLSENEKAAYGAARSVIARAGGTKKTIVIGGTVAGLSTPVQPTDDDVKEALKAMDINDNGDSMLNFFIQRYRANDFPFYEHYAIHRATEPLAGPRQIVVAK